MHPNITTVFDYGEDDHLSYLVMELVEGLPLSAVIRDQGALDPRTCARSSPRPPSRSARPTRPVSSTATSSPPTSCCAPTAS